MPFNWIRKLATREENASPKEASARALSQALRGKCPRCQNALHNHAFQMFAATVASAEKKDAISDFIRKAQSHDWKSLAKLYDFDPSKNALEVYALRCHDGGLNLLFVRDPFELSDGPSVENWEALDQTEGTKWLGYLSKDKWVCFVEMARTS